MSTTISSVRSSEAARGPRGEIEHVRTDAYSMNFWNLRDLARSDTHHNDYTLAIYISEGVLSVYDADGQLNQIHAGDSVLVPAGTDYSMSAEHADAVEIRIN